MPRTPAASTAAGRSAPCTCGGGIMSRVLSSTCRFLSRQRLSCQLGCFFFLSASILKWFTASVGILCWRPPPRLIVTSYHDENLGLVSCVEMGMALLGRTWSSPVPTPVPREDIPEEWPKPECGSGMGGQQGEFCDVWWGRDAMEIWLQTWKLSPEWLNPAFG